MDVVINREELRLFNYNLYESEIISLLYNRHFSYYVETSKYGDKILHVNVDCNYSKLYLLLESISYITSFTIK